MMRRVATVAAVIATLGLAGCADDLTAPSPTATGLSHDWTLVLVPLPAPTDFVEITAGGSHTCARQFRGYVYCWGYNSGGQVGTIGSDPTPCSGFTCVIQPTFVTIASSVEAGDAQTCALNSGQASCWGLNVAFAPTAVPAVTGVSFSSISVGLSSTCATSTAGVYCWNGISTPSQLTSYQNYTGVAIGSHGCAMDIVGSSREVACWGANDQGQTTLDPAVFGEAPVTVGTLFGSAVTRVSAAADFTCVDQQSGIVQCAGTNLYGQLGSGYIPVAPNPTYTNIPQTVKLPPGPPICISAYRCIQPRAAAAPLHAVSAGWTHSCALDPNGYAYCWGNGASGQLGNGGASTSAYAVAVAGGHTYRAIAAGAQHTCAIGTDNVIYCWGDGAAGQLGTGLTSDSSPVPKPTGALRPWIVPNA